jgi:hypothetical protein
MKNTSPVAARCGRLYALFAALLIVVGAVLFLVPALPKPGQPERVRASFSGVRATSGSPPPLEKWRVRGGRVVQVVATGREVIVADEPLGGGAARPLYRASVPSGERVYPGACAFAERGVWIYRRVYAATAGTWAGGNGGGSVLTAVSGTRSEWHVYRDTGAAPPPLPGEQWQSVPDVGFSEDWRAEFAPYEAVAGLPPPLAVSAPPGKRVSGPVFSGEHVFWKESDAVGSRVRRYVRAGSPATKVEETFAPGRTTLWARSAAGEKPRPLARDLTDTNEIIPVAGGVALAQPRAYPDRRQDLLLFLPPDFRPRRVPAWREDYRFDSPALYLTRGRLWWLEYGAETTESEGQTCYLVSLAPDGTGRQRVALTGDARGNGLLNPALAFDGRDTLYLRYATAGTPRPSDGAVSLTFCLARWLPDRGELAPPFLSHSSALEAPTPDRLDGDYFYFSRVDTQTNPLDALFAETTMRNTRGLYRLRLPSP